MAFYEPVNKLSYDPQCHVQFVYYEIIIYIYNLINLYIFPEDTEKYFEKV